MSFHVTECNLNLVPEALMKSDNNISRTFKSQKKRKIIQTKSTNNQSHDDDHDDPSDDLPQTPMAQAINYAENFGYILPVIAREVNNKGGRIFEVTPWHVFFKKYIKIKPEERMYHEYIGEHYPCNVFLDIDKKIPKTLTDTERNSEMNILNRKTQMIIWYIACKMHEYFSVITKFVVISDSSRSEKFSRHVVITLRKNTMFKNNLVLGSFIKYILNNFCDNKTNDNNNNNNDSNGDVSDNHSEYNMNTQHEIKNLINERDPTTFFYHQCQKEEKKDLLIDMSLYKGPKQLRLLYSRKNSVSNAKEFVFLKPIYICKEILNFHQFDENSFIQGNWNDVKSMRSLFFFNLICTHNILEKATVKYLCDFNGKSNNDSCMEVTRSYSKTPLGKFFINHYIQKHNFTVDSNTESFLKERLVEDTTIKNSTINVCEKVNAKNESWKSERCYGILPKSRFQNSKSNNGGFNQALFRKIGENIEEKCNFQRTKDYLTNPSFNPESGLLNFSCPTSKKCEVIRKEHKSNHCYFLVNLKFKYFTRKCPDEECKEKLNSVYSKMKSYKKGQFDIEKECKILKIHLPQKHYLDMCLWEEIDSFLKEVALSQMNID